MVTEVVVEAINKQIGIELAAALQHLAISWFFQGETLPELTAFFIFQYQEELMHAQKLATYLTDQNAQAIVLLKLAGPQNHFASVKAAVVVGLEQEKKNTEYIHQLYLLAQIEGDLATCEFLRWFVSEQIEEVALMSDLLKTVEHAGASVLLVEDYLVRHPHPAALIAAAGTTAA